MSDLTVNRYRSTPNSTFEMLKVPLGAILSATFRGQEYKAKVIDSKNQIIDLLTGEVATPSGMANKYLGGSNNGWEYFRYNGKKLSEIRSQKDSGYYYHTLPEQEPDIAVKENNEIIRTQEIKNEELRERIYSLVIIPAIKKLIEKEDEELYKIISKEVANSCDVIPTREMVFKSVKKIFTQQATQANVKPSQRKTMVSDQEIITYSPGEKAGTNKDGIKIEIEQVVKNYQDYPTDWEPEDDYEYVQIKLSFTNNSEYSKRLNNIDFCIKDGGGIIDYAMDRHTTFPFDKELSGGGSKVDGTMLFYVRKRFVNSLTFIYDGLYDKITIQL